MHPLLNEYGTQNTSLSLVNSSEKDIIKSSLSEITKGWDIPGKHGTRLHQGGQLCVWLLALASQSSN